MATVDTLGLARQRSLNAAADQLGQPTLHRLSPLERSLRLRKRIRRNNFVRTASASGAPERVTALGIVGVRTSLPTVQGLGYKPPGVKYIIRGAGSNGVARAYVSATLDQLAVLRAELHNAGVGAATDNIFYLPPSLAVGQANQASVLDEWLTAQLSDELAAPILNKFLPCPSYLALVCADPSPSPSWIRPGSRVKPTRLQAAQRRLAFALAELEPPDESESTDMPVWLSSSLIVDLLCGDVQEQIGLGMSGIQYPHTQPTPEALVAASRVAGTKRLGLTPLRKECLRLRDLAELTRLIDAGPQQCEMAVGGKSEVSRPGNFARQQARRHPKKTKLGVRLGRR